MASVKQLHESPLTADYQSVEYRLNNRKRFSSAETNSTRTFAVELNNGSMVRVVVSSDQAEQFERELSMTIQQNPDADIGNILYELTRLYDIYDIQWTGEFDDEAAVVEDSDLPPPDTSGEPAVDPAAEPSPDPLDGDEDGGNGGGEGMFDTNTPVDLDAIEDGDGNEGDVEDLDAPSLKDVLQTMISQLTADSDARRAEAEARRAEADAAKAQAVARAMELRVGQEREMQAMEDWESQERDKKNSEKKLGRLAKFRLAQAQGLTDSRIPTGTPIRGRLSEGYVPRGVAESAPATAQMMKHLRDVTAAIRGRPQTNARALDNLNDATLDMMTDMQAQRAQASRDVAVARRAGDTPAEVQDARKIADLKLAFSRRVAVLRQQLDQNIQRVSSKA